MSLAVTREQILPAVEKPAEAPASLPSTGGDWVKSVVVIVKESCERGDFLQIGEQLRTLKLTSPQITKETIGALITHVKEVTPALDLPIVYRYLIQDLQLNSGGDYIALANLSPKDEAF